MAIQHPSSTDAEAQDETLDKDPSTSHSDDKKKDNNDAIQPSATEVSDVATTYTKKSYVARLKPVEGKNLRNKNIMLKLMSRPFSLLTFPIVAFAGFLYGSNITWLSVLNATQSMVLANEPYNLSTSSVGLTFFAPLVGTTLA